MKTLEKITKTICNNGDIHKIDSCSLCINLIAVNDGTAFACKHDRSIVMKYAEVKERIHEDCPL